MQKVFFYRDIEIPIKANQEVYLRIEFKTPGNYVNSSINIPGDNDFSILNEGNKLLGKGLSLKSEPTIIVSEVLNFVNQIDNIGIKYYINDKKILEYDKPKSESDRPLIVIQLKFNINE